MLIANNDSLDQKVMLPIAVPKTLEEHMRYLDKCGGLMTEVFGVSILLDHSLEACAQLVH